MASKRSREDSGNETQDRNMDIDQAQTDEKGADAATNVSTIVGVPLPRILKANVHTFVQRYCLLLNTFAQACKLTEAGATLVNLVKPLYIFNGAHVGQYTTANDLVWLSALANKGLGVFVNHLKGAVKLVGINSPFVTQAADQAATNSALSLLGMTAVGLERIAPVYQGQATIDDTSATLTDWTVDAVNGGYDWQARQVPTASAAPTATSWTKVVDGADSNFVEYKTVAALRTGLSTNDLSNYPMIGRSMTMENITESKGVLTEWHHKMRNCALILPNIASNSMLSKTTAQVASVSPDWVASVPVADSTAAISAIAATSSSSGKQPTKDMYLAHNNCYRIGDMNQGHFELPTKNYIGLVPPPTVSVTLTQDAFIQVVLDVEMDVRIERDQTMNGQSVFSNEHSYLYKSNFLGASNCWMDGNNLAP